MDSDCEFIPHDDGVIFQEDGEEILYQTDENDLEECNQCGDYMVLNLTRGLYICPVCGFVKLN